MDVHNLSFTPVPESTNSVRNKFRGTIFAKPAGITYMLLESLEEYLDFLKEDEKIEIKEIYLNLSEWMYAAQNEYESQSGFMKLCNYFHTQRTVDRITEEASKGLARTTDIIHFQGRIYAQEMKISQIGVAGSPPY